MKNIMTFGTIIAVHLVAFIMIAAQPACTSTKGAKRPQGNRNTELNNNTEVLKAQELQEGNPALRVAPSRPTWTLDDKRNTGEVLVNEENQAPTSGLLMPTELDSQVEVDSIVESSAMPEIYVVKSGDNLTKIAKENKTTVGAIKDLNKLKNNNIYIGQKLKIPAPSQISTSEPKASVVADSKNIYIVKSGDSLSKVAFANKTTISAIKELNSLKNDVIFVGQKLKMPEPSVIISSPEQSKPNNNYETYTVKRGDTLGAIALQNKISLLQIQKLNPAVNPNRLQVGQVLVIKEKALAPIVEENNKAPAAPIISPAPAVQASPVPAEDKQTPNLTPKIEEKNTPEPEATPEPTVEEINILTV